MITYLQRLTAERDSLTQSATQLAERAASDDRDLSETERASMAGWQQRCGEIDSQLTEYNSQAESARAYAQLRSQLDAPADDLAHGAPGAPVIETRSAGAIVVQSDAFANYRGNGQMSPVSVEGFLATRAAITTAQLAIPHYVHAPVEIQSSAPLLDVCGHVMVSSGVVDWVEIGGDPQAAVVPEGSAKPEAAFTATPKTAALDTLAHWVQITRQALQDAAYIQSLIESKLRRGLLNKAEADMAAAIDAATTQTSSTTAAQGGMLASIRVGIGKVQSAGYQPNAVVLNPADFAALDVDVMGKTTTGPVSAASFWGMTPVAAAAIPAGKAYVGDFANAATLFDRGVTDVFVSDSHAALFISNILVILAEARLKSAITEPLAICECVTVP